MSLGRFSCEPAQMTTVLVYLMALVSNVLCHQLHQLGVNFFTGKELEQKQATCAEPVPVKAAMPIAAAEPEVALFQGSAI